MLLLVKDRGLGAAVEAVVEGGFGVVVVVVVVDVVVLLFVTVGRTGVGEEGAVEADVPVVRPLTELATVEAVATGKIKRTSVRKAVT